MVDMDTETKGKEGRKIMCEAVEKYANQRAIKADVEAGIAYGATKDRIISRLCDKFGLSREEAEKQYAAYAVASV